MAKRKAPRKPAPRVDTTAPVLPAPAPERPSPGAVRGRPFPKGNTVGADTRFQPGQTGNPGGVPKNVHEFRDLLRQRTLVALARVDDILDHGSEEGIIKAVREVWANGWGRAPLPITGEGGGPVKITYDDVRQRVAKAAARAVAAEEPGDGEGEEEEEDAGDGGSGSGDAGVRSDEDG